MPAWSSAPLGFTFPARLASEAVFNYLRTDQSSIGLGYVSSD